MNIKETFLKLTDRTYPHGTESELFHLLPSNLETDEFGNLFLKIGESDVMFTSHLDTATSSLSKINHKIEGDLIRSDGTTILGADDKAGVTIMLKMIENKIPGLYYFFLGEEVGCVGSKKLASKQKENKIPGINKVISFDRRGVDSIITYQAGSRCCSEKFGEALSSELNKYDSTFSYKNDPTGIYTDSAQFVSIYPECTNISVGYRNEHTYNEVQDIKHLEKLADACLKVDWISLPTERDPSVIEYKHYSSMDFEYYPSEYRTSKEVIKKSEIHWFYDKKFNFVSKLEIDNSGLIIDSDLSSERIEYETMLINQLLMALELDYEWCKWDGTTLKVMYETNHQTDCTRNDLIEYLPELDYRNMDEIGGVKDEYYSEYCDDFM